MRRAGIFAGHIAGSSLLLPLLLLVTASAQSPRPSLSHPHEPPARLAHRRFLSRHSAISVSHLAYRPTAALTHAVLPQATTSTTWTAAGPLAVSTPNFGLVTGRVSSIALDPSDTTGNAVYLGATGGGLWKSQNAGATSPVFTPVTDNQPALTGLPSVGLSIGAVTVQPGGTGVILAGLGDPNDALDSYYGAGILRSTNNGQTWTLIQQTTDRESGYGLQDYSFIGEGLSSFAWSSTSPQLVVAAVSQAYEATLVTATLPGLSYQGLYYSTDSGATWHLARITDGSTGDVQGPSDAFAAPDGNAATSVIWNPARQLFIAAVRYHGYYQSSDGVTFTRMAAQPGAGLAAGFCPTESGSVGVAGCPIFRGALAVNPSTGDTFAWTVDIFNQDQGIWQDACVISGVGSSATCTNPTITFANQLNTSALEVSGEGGDATIPNGDYNLTLAAIPSQQDTLLFAGANDLFRCSLANSCAWRNTTNTGTCFSAQVGPYQHALAWNSANPLELFLGNDSGLWRSTDDVAQTGSVCATTDASHFQNLNSGLGSLAEIESLSQPSSPATTLLAGLGANGTAATITGPTATTWSQILSGEGGPVAVDRSSSGNSWYVNNASGVSIFHCGAVAGANCTPSAFGSTPVIGETQVLNDGLGLIEPAPFAVDTLDPSQLLIGTCRLWRGPKTGAGWSASNAISPVLDGSPTTYDCAGNSLIRSIAAGITSTGETLYVGMAGADDAGGLAAGHLFSATINTAGSLTGSWTDLTSSPVTNTGLSFNPAAQDVSSLYVDPHDASGQTIYATVSAFDPTSQPYQQIYRSINGGASWTDIGSNLPNAPVNAILVDSQDPGTLYAATDLGVYLTRAIPTCATASCWSPYGAGLPLAPVTALSIAAQTLTAATYGRGAWQIPLITAGTTLTTAAFSPTSLTFASTAISTSSTAQNILFKNTGTAPLTITSLVFTGVAQTDYLVNSSTCIGVTLATNVTCTASIVFAPTVAGTRTATLSVAANVSGGQLLVPLTGTAVAAPAVSLNPTALNFGSIQVSTASTAQFISVQNNGGLAVTITSSTATSPFTITASTCSGTLAANTSCLVTITFKPGTTGSFTGTLTVKDSLGTQTATLTGTALSAPTDTLSATTLTFPSTVIGQASSPLTVTLTNSGGEPLAAIGTSISGTPASQFSVTSNCSSTLAPASSCTFYVVFSPTINGALAATLAISDAVHAQNISLRGTGLKPPLLALSKSSLSFPATQIGIASTALNLTVSNTGGAPLAQPGFAFTGPGAAAFTASSTTCGATLAASATCTVSLTFTPVAAGSTSATLIVSSSTLGVVPVTATLTGTGLTPPSIGASPATLNLGSVTVGNSSALFSVQVTNTGQVALNLPTFSIGNLSAGAAAADFALSAPTDITACTVAVNPGASCYIQITFTPSVIGPETATLTIASTNAIPASVTIALTGTGTSPITLIASPPALTFGSLAVGLTSGSQTLTLSNTGRQAASNLTLALTGPYALVPALTTCTANLGIKASCTVGLTFTPAASGNQPGSLTASVSNLGVPPVTVSLDGTGLTVGGLTLSPSQITFGSVLINTTSAAQSLTITNSGQAALANLKLQLIGNGFTLSSNTCAATLAAGASCTAAITFKPTSAISFTGTLTVSTTSPGVSSAVFTAIGYGIPNGFVTATPSVASFGSVTIGQTSPPQSVLLTNTGPTLTGLSFVLSGDYSLPANTCGTQLASGSSCTLSVTFSPSQPGTRIGAVTVKSTTSGYTPFVVGLTGTGLPAAQLIVSPTSLSFGSVLVGSNSAAIQLTVSNPGTGTLTGLGFTATAPFTVGSGTCGSLLAAGAACSVPITFTPSATGSQPGSLVVLTTSLGVSSVTVPLSGAGALPASLSISPASVSFPATTLEGSSPAQTLTVTNPGVVSLAGLTLTVSGPFSLQTTTCGATLAAAGSCTALVLFKPTVAGSATGFLTASSATRGIASATASLLGDGITPALLTITPAQLTFPATLVGAVSSTQTLTIANTGQTALSDLALALSPPFSLSSTTCTAALAGGAHCTASVLFAPTTAGAATGSLVASSTAALISASANLTGTGALAPAILTNPSTLLQFPTTSVGVSATPIAVTITNQGTAASLTGLTLSLDASATAAGFGLTANTCTATLAAQAGCTVQITFTPATYGTLTGNLILTSANGGSARITLAGFGFSFNFVVTGSSTTTVIQGQTAYFNFAVTPLGGASGTVSFACGQLPAKALCIFNPGQFAGLRATGDVQLGISTGSPTTALLHPASPPRSYSAAIAALLLFPALFWRIRHLRSRRVITFALLFSFAVTGLFGCAGSGGKSVSGGLSHPTGGTPTGTYPVTITATSGGLSRTVQVTLIVN